MTSVFSNKKGQTESNIGNGIIFMFGFFVVVIVFIIGNVLLSSVNDDFQDSSQISDLGKQLVNDNQSRFVQIFDNMALFAFVGGAIALIIAAFFARSHPAVFFISLPFLAFLIFLAAVNANFFALFTANSSITQFAADFSIATFIIQNYPYFITAIIIIFSIALYAKNNQTPVQ